MEPTTTTAAGRLRAYAEADGTQDLDELLAFFDELPAVESEEMLGEWQGGIVRTGHPGEGQLDAIRWAGKAFRSFEDVDPIVSRTADGGREANGVLGAARLRDVRYRGVVTATMAYDQHPVLDHFRRVDERTVLGVMDRKGEDRPLVFFLERL